MCTNIGVSLPTVVSFLLLYSLRCGCIVTLLWTAIRILVFTTFFILAIIEAYLPRPPLIGNVFPIKPEAPEDEYDYYIVFMVFLIMVVVESILGMYLIYLGIGLYYDSPGRIVQYLVCRFVVWILETLIIVVLCLVHHCLIGWYLVFLMVIILEFYGFIVVYSYYMDMLDDYKLNQTTCSSIKDAQMQSTPCPC